VSDYDRPSAPPHILANALSDPIDLPPGRGRAAKSARVSAPGTFTAAERAGRDAASEQAYSAGDGDVKAARIAAAGFLTGLPAALPLLRAEWEQDYAALAREVCPAECSEPGDAAFICMGEDGDPIIEAETPLEAIRQALECWERLGELREREQVERPALQAMVRAETIAEVLALLDDETEKAESAFGGRTPFSLALGTMAERVRAMLDPDPTPPEVAP